MFILGKGLLAVDSKCNKAPQGKPIYKHIITVYTFKVDHSVRNNTLQSSMLILTSLRLTKSTYIPSEDRVVDIATEETGQESWDMAIWYRVKVSGSEFEDERVEDVQGEFW
jgi:hypothetical protein